jgi:4-amino-4-deoxy-L-arabinose transferase-like glycosyltransferase
MNIVTRAARRLATFTAINQIVLIGAMLIALGLGAWTLRNPDWIGCWEACGIATAVSEGHGYSEQANHRWLFSASIGDDQDPLRYYPTAWVDPVYTYALAAVFSTTGSLHKVVAVWLNPLLFVIVVVLTFLLASRIEGDAAGLLSATLIAWILGSRRWEWIVQLNNTLLATLFVLLFAMALYRAVTAPSLKSASVLGLATGIAILACPGAIAFLPLAPLAMFLANWRRWRPSVTRAFLTLCIAIAVLTPWAIRNYLAFGEFVPVRTGSGQIAFVGVVATGATVDPSTLKNEVNPPWRASDPRVAVMTSRNDQNSRRALEAFQLRYAQSVGGSKFHGMNEAQRDKWFQNESREYILKHPMLSINLAVWKVLLFGSIMGPLSALLLALALLGGALAIIRRRLDLLSFVACIIGFIAPYTIIIPYFTRYRIPIEPMIVVAAVVTIRELGRILGFSSRRQEDLKWGGPT